MVHVYGICMVALPTALLLGGRVALQWLVSSPATPLTSVGPAWEPLSRLPASLLVLGGSFAGMNYITVIVKQWEPSRQNCFRTLGSAAGYLAFLIGIAYFIPGGVPLDLQVYLSAPFLGFLPFCFGLVQASSEKSYGDAHWLMRLQGILAISLLPAHPMILAVTMAVASCWAGWQIGVTLRQRLAGWYALVKPQ